MPSSNKAAVVRVPEIRNFRPSQSSKDVFNCSIASNGISTGSQMASISAQDTPKLPRTPETPRTWTYRVRGIPVGLDWEGTLSLIQSTLRLSDWELRSLAPDPIRDREQVATFEVLQPPYSTLEPRSDCQWQFPISHILNQSTESSNRSICEGNLSVGGFSASKHSLPDGKIVERHRKSTITVDKHFLGLTPLNRRDENQNFIEYSISSYFQVAKLSITVVSPYQVLVDMPLDLFKDKDSQYMWLRDSLPDDLPDLRIFIYGYESGLQGSNSFQNLRDVGESFRDSLRNLKRPQNVCQQLETPMHTDMKLEQQLSAFTTTDLHRA